MARNPQKSVGDGRAWQRMLSGRRLDLLDPSPMDIEITDIAHGLARVARWNGQTQGDWALSVAQHSIVVEQIIQKTAPALDLKWRRAALLHDAPEYVIGDMITPFKAVIGPAYKVIENRLQEAVHLRFGLPAKLPERAAKTIKRADHIAAYIEATPCAGFTLDDANTIFGRPRQIPDIQIEAWSPRMASDKFLARFAVLGGN